MYIGGVLWTPAESVGERKVLQITMGMQQQKLGDRLKTHQ